MGCGNVTLKACLGLISVFFWICAIALVVIGSVILAEYGQIQELAQSTDILIPSVIVIGAGVFLFIVGLLGCIGGMKGNKAALTLFFICMLVIVVGEVLAVALGYHYKGDIKDNLTDKMHSMLKECSNSSDSSCDELDFIQSKLYCCGADNYTDWYKWTSENYTLPESCCREKDCTTPSKEDTNGTVIHETIYTEGCADKLIDVIDERFTWIFVGTIIVVVLQVLALVATCVMLFRSKETPYSSLDSQGYRI